MKLLKETLWLVFQIVLAAAAFHLLTGCSTPDLTGLSKDERKFVLQSAEARRQAWRAVGIGLVNFGLNSAANSFNRERGFAK